MVLVGNSANHHLDHAAGLFDGNELGIFCQTFLRYVVTGQRQLEELRLSRSSLNLEATILYYTIKGFINQQFDEAAKGFEDYLKTQPVNRLLLFLGVTMLVKNSQCEESFLKLGLLKWAMNLR